MAEDFSLFGIRAAASRSTSSGNPVRWPAGASMLPDTGVRELSRPGLNSGRSGSQRVDLFAHVRPWAAPGHPIVVAVAEIG